MKTKDTNTDIDIEPAEEAVVNEALKDVADVLSSPNAYKHLMASDFQAMPLRPKMQLFRTTTSVAFLCGEIDWRRCAFT